MKIMDKKNIFILTLILVLGIVLRVLAAMLIGGSRVPWELEFEEIARNLVQHGTYSFSFYGLSSNQPSSFIPPIYPLFLAAARTLSPTNGDWLIKAIQIITSELSVIGLYALTREVGGSTRQGLLTAMLWTVYPPAIAFANDLSTVTLEAFFFISGILLLLRATKQHSIILVIPAGVLLSLAALTRATWLVVLPLAIFWLAWYLRGEFRVWGKSALLFGLAACITMAPWVIYNYRVQGKLMLTSTNGGLNFWIGNNAHATGEYIFPTQIDRDLVLSVADWSEMARDQFFYAQGVKFIRNSPVEFVNLLFRKLLYSIFFRPNIGSNYEAAQFPLYSLAILSFVVAWLALIPFALLGLFNMGNRWREHMLLILVFFGNLGTSVLYFSGTRFRMPVDGFAMIWASIGLTFLAKEWKRRKLSRSSKKIEEVNDLS
jgi:4-amino-4-deoxy-L-arabinose transferase-like glycosyltransferase